MVLFLRLKNGSSVALRSAPVSYCQLAVCEVLLSED